MVRTSAAERQLELKWLKMLGHYVSGSYGGFSGVFGAFDGAASGLIGSEDSCFAPLFRVRRVHRVHQGDMGALGWS